MHIIVQAGGKGTRLESFTRNKPKCLVSVNNRPIIFSVLDIFGNENIQIIADYKSDVLVRYLNTFAAERNVRVVQAVGKGTSSGIGDALANINDDGPVIVVWCDLLLNENFRLPDNVLSGMREKNYIGLSGTFPCRWSFASGEFKHQPSSSQGVAGFFVFKNKSELDGIPGDGPFVPWLSRQKIEFEPFYLENVTEVGTMEAFEALTKPAICRPFNEVVLNDETVVKRGINEQGKKIATDEIAWYRYISKTDYNAIPRIHSYDPLVMERIKGKNIWEYNCLTLSEKRSIIKSIVDNLKELHAIDQKIPAQASDLYDNYIGKTFDRLSKVKDLVPFAKDEYIKINNRYYRNVFYDSEQLEEIVKSYYPEEFSIIHGDPTFSNMLYDRVNRKVYLIDPRGYFGQSKLYGDVDYDWAKVYYSLAGDYDQFNRKHFALAINKKDVELAILPNNWADMEEYFFELLDGVPKKKIRILHAIIWLSLTTYVWDDYDSVCGAFYNGILKTAEFF